MPQRANQSYQSHGHLCPSRSIPSISMTITDVSPPTNRLPLPPPTHPSGLRTTLSLLFDPSRNRKNKHKHKHKHTILYIA